MRRITQGHTRAPAGTAAGLADKAAVTADSQYGHRIRANGAVCMPTQQGASFQAAATANRTPASLRASRPEGPVAALLYHLCGVTGGRSALVSISNPPGCASPRGAAGVVMY